jgi:hypothetical protein
VDLALLEGDMNSASLEALGKLAESGGLLELDLRTLVDRRQRELDGRAARARAEEAARAEHEEHDAWQRAVADHRDRDWDW